MSRRIPTDSLAPESGAATRTPESPFVSSERIRILFAQARSGLVVNLLVAAALAAYLWDAVPVWSSVTWLAVIATTVVVRAGVLMAFRRRDPAADELSVWRTRLMLGALAAGAAWGIAPWVFGPFTALQHHVVLMLTLGGMAVGGISVLASDLRTYNGFAGALCLIAMLWFAMQEDPTHRLIAVLTVVFLGALVMTARNFSISLTRGLTYAEANRRLSTNLTHSQERENTLRHDRERLRDFADLGADVFWETDADLRYSFLSPRSEEILGISADRLTGVSLGSGLGAEHAGEEALRSAADARAPFKGLELAVIRPDGEVKNLLCSGKPVFGSGGEFVGYRGTWLDVTAQHALADRLTYQATHDLLTGLLNRREFESRLARAVETAGQHGHRHVLLYLDLDRFKVINDTCGHAAGDALLREITAEIRGRLRGRDSFARLGGDEFGVLMEQCPLEAALVVAEALRTAVESFRFEWTGSRFELGISIGILEISAGSQDAAQCLTAADAACYAAKDAGRNRVQVFDSADPRIDRQRRETLWVNRVNEALRDSTLMLVAQPIAQVSGLSNFDPSWPPERCELLLRFPDGCGGVESPNRVLPIAERFNLAPQLDRWVVGQAIAWLSRPEIRCVVRSCSVNLSGQSLDERGFSDYVVEQLTRMDVAPGVLCFEITETAAVENFEAAVRFMQLMRHHGCRFALDDFGTGYSSLSYLKALPADYLKIDGLFIRNLLTDATDRELVVSMHSLGRIFGMQTVAEFVDSEELYAPLREIGIDYAQGYAVGVPVPLHGEDRDPT